MTPTERAKRSDALYYETVSVTRRVLCDMIANREADLEDARTENAKLREQMERLVTLLRVDCDIDASWDGLRRFWSIGLTEDGCLMRDRACKAEAENAKLREDLEFERSENGWAREFLNRMGQKCGTDDCPSLVAYVNNLESDNSKLRELVADMYKAFMHGNCYRWCEFKEPCNYISDGRCQWYDRMRELGVDA